ncbi:MAG TPA: hypothetical protein ENG87_03520 [Candidatus Pacearchaeota archaeon]|nr:hypothetical protein BMS3Abin17_01209 [archaeon BMS3Abin17]HDK42423.1 hypothetical protein [Candidatus Pacearchaeota archaeon]HDZ60427.1 hypothetical protein [Candidatus Pacearchaeota archaeon]
MIEKDEYRNIELKDFRKLQFKEKVRFKEIEGIVLKNDGKYNLTLIGETDFGTIIRVSYGLRKILPGHPHLIETERKIYTPFGFKFWKYNKIINQ